MLGSGDWELGKTEVPGARCQAVEVGIPGPDCQKRRTTFWLLTLDYRSLQVHPAMLMKTKRRDREKVPGVRCQMGTGFWGKPRCRVSGASPARCASLGPDCLKRRTIFCLLASDS